MWIEQLLNFKKYRHHVITYLILSILTGMFVVISLLPLVGLWFQVTALACGALLMPCLLRHPSVRHTSASACRQTLKHACCCCFT